MSAKSILNLSSQQIHGCWEKHNYRTTTKRKQRKGFALQMSMQTLEIAQKVMFKVTALRRNLSLQPKAHLFLALLKSRHFFSVSLPPLAILTPLAAFFSSCPHPSAGSASLKTKTWHVCAMRKHRAPLRAPSNEKQSHRGKLQSG